MVQEPLVQEDASASMPHCSQLVLLGVWFRLFVCQHLPQWIPKQDRWTHNGLYLLQEYIIQGLCLQLITCWRLLHFNSENNCTLSLLHLDLNTIASAQPLWLFRSPEVIVPNAALHLSLMFCYWLVQIDVGLYVSLGVCLGVVCIRPSPQLHSVRPARRLISLTVLGPVALFMAFYAVQQGIAVAILKRQSWYQRDKSQVCIQIHFPEINRCMHHGG